MNAALNRVAFIIDHENDRLETDAHHCRDFLDGQLANIITVR